jgi:rhodanese-related sulfurtransferase
MTGLRFVGASPYTNVDVDTAYNMITNGSYPDLIVLDVRTKSEYDSGHIFGTTWIPVAELESRIGELATHKEHEIIVYCLSGGRSVTASNILDSNNFTKVYNMLEGITA